MQYLARLRGQLRMRTVQAVTQTELCWITRDDLLVVCEGTLHV